MKIDFETSAVAVGFVVPAPAAATEAAAPPLQFDLPGSLQRQLVATTAAFLVVMALTFRGGDGIGLIFAIIGIVFAGYFGLPLLMARASRAPALRSPRGAWGIETASGYLPGHAAWIQVMTVPLVMLAWAIAVAILH